MGYPSSFWDIVSMFLIETFLHDILLLTIDLLTSIHFFQHDLHACFWETLRPKLFGLFIGPLGAPIGLSPHFSWGDWLHLHIVHCTNDLFGEQGICCTYHHH